MTFFPLTLAPALAQTCSPGEIRAIVIDSQESPIFNAEVQVKSDAAALEARSTQTTGRADIENVPCGDWTVTVVAEGFDAASETVRISSGTSTQVRIVLHPRMQTSSVDVTEKAPPLEQAASQNSQLKPQEVKTLPANPGTVNDTLPLVPGVVRGRDGELKIDGAGQERSAMVVNQSDITDPATGQFGESIPIDSIEAVTVLQTPFLAQYGRFTQSVVAVETKRGGDKWHAELNDPFPDFRVRSHHLRGIRNETPRAVAGGPLIANRLYLISAFQYYFQRESSRTLPFPFNESRTQFLNSFTQLDWILTPKQFVTATLHISPLHTNFVNPDYFHPQPTTPSFSQHTYDGTLIDHMGFLRGIVDSSVSIQHFDVNVGAQGPEGMTLTPTVVEGNFFGTQSRFAKRTEWLETWSLAPIDLLGSHLIKMGSSVTESSNEGQFGFRPVLIEDLAGQLTQRVDFNNPLPFNRTDLEVTAYLQDHWAVTKGFSVDYGGRVEHQRLAASLRIAPRAGISWSPFPNGQTVFRAGYGLFYDHLPLDIYTFGRYPQRTITDFDENGNPIGPPVIYTNVIGISRGPRSFFVNGKQVAGAFSPRGATLNLQMEHRFNPHFRVRGVYTDSQAVGLVVFTPDPVLKEIVLSGDGKSRYRQLEVTGRLTWQESQQLVFSYTRASANGNLNTFDSFLGNFPTPLVRPNLTSNLPGDIPNRFVVWGTLKPHIAGLQVLPTIEYRNGFPFAKLDAAQNYVDLPYANSTRFPDFLSVDTRLMRDFKVSPKYTVRLSLTGFNITNHFNALAVHDNIADPRYGVFFGNYHRRYRGDFEIIF